MIIQFAREGGASLPGPLAALRRCLHELAAVSDAIVESTERRDGGELMSELFERAAELRARLAQANADAKGCALPAGPQGATLVAEIRTLNARIRAGSVAAEKIVASRETVEAFGGRIVLQTLENMASIAAWPSVARLRDSFRGLPAVIVSAGPSLDKNIDVLKRFEGKAVVIAVSHALSALVRAGIHVDVCVAVDTQDLAYHFAGGGVEQLGALVLGTSAHPGLFALPARRVFTVAGNAVLDGWAHDGFEEAFVCRSGGSVANHAFSLATLWGCDPIILVGQDLSFPGQKFYASSSCDGDARVEIAADGRSAVVRDASKAFGDLGGGDQVLMREVPGYYGGTVPTSFAFEKAWEWFVETARGMSGSRTLLNCTEGGARIDGMDHVPLADAASKFATRGVAIDDVLDAAIGSIDRPARRRQMRERLEDMLAAIARAAARASECVELGARGGRREAMRALAEKERELARAVDAIDFVSTMVQPEIRAAVAAGKRARTLEAGLAASVLTYRAVQRIASEARAPIERALTALRADDAAVPFDLERR
jgi:hypothetical protein